MGLPAYGNFYVYMLECADGSYYVGLTRKCLDDRIYEHMSGAYRGSTFVRRPVTLVWSQQFGRLTDAIARERQLKGWRREKKQALIHGEWSLLPALSKTAKPNLSH